MATEPTNDPRSRRDRLKIRRLRDLEELVVFRIVRTADIEDPNLVESFRSNADLGKPAVGRAERLPALHRGISVFKTRAQAADRRRRIVERLTRGGSRESLRIGDHVATLRLVGASFRVEDRDDADGHMTVWGDASSLAAAVVEIVDAEFEDSTG